MAKIKVLNMVGEAAGNITLADGIFGIELTESAKAAMHTMVVHYLAAKRQGTQSTLTRTEVRGGGRKPWRQKGTGRARQGSIRSPQWRGGGIALGPKPRSYRFGVNKKLRRLAMKAAFTSKLIEKQLIVIDSFNIEEIKTKAMVACLAAIGVTTPALRATPPQRGIGESVSEGEASSASAAKIAKILIVTSEPNENLIKSARNIPGVKTAIATSINVYDILKHDYLVLTKDAVKKIEEVYV